MKFTYFASLLASAALAQTYGTGSGAAYDQEFIPDMDYTHARADFNKNEYIWDQGDYEERVKIEAEVMVALEVLTDLYDRVGDDFQTLSYCDSATSNFTRSHMLNNAMLQRQASDTFNAVYEIDRQMYDVLYTCQTVEVALQLNRDALRLYCQQFAFAPVMVAPCAELLTCSGTERPYSYPFQGGYVAPTRITYDPPTIESGNYTLAQQINMGYYGGTQSYNTYESSPTGTYTERTRDSSNYSTAVGY